MVSPTSAQMTGPRDKERIIIPWYVPYRIYKIVIFFGLSSDENHCEKHAYLQQIESLVFKTPLSI